MVYLIDADVMIDVSRRTGLAPDYIDSLGDPAISIRAVLRSRQPKPEAFRDDRCPSPRNTSLPSAEIA